MILNLTEIKQKFNLNDLPVSIVGNGTVATITLQSHNFKTGDYLNVTGTAHYNGLQLATRLSPTQVSFASSATQTEQGVIKPWDIVLTKLMNQVDNHIKMFCDLEFGNTESKTEKHDLKLDGVIYPKRGYLTEEGITSIKLSRVNNFTDATKYITLTSEQYFVYDDRIQLRFDACGEYLNCAKAVSITYAPAECPDGLKSIAEQIMEFYFRTWNDRSISENSRSTGGDQVAFAKQLPEFILEDLSKYARVNMGSPY